MIKILIYVSLLLTTGVASTESLSLLDDTLLTQQFGYCDQAGDDKDNDSPEMVLCHHAIGTYQKKPLIAIEQLTGSYRQFSSTSYFIRAPPISN